MHRVIVLDKHGTTTERLYEGTEARRASLTYCRAVLRRRKAHIQWIEGVPPKVHAQRFGDPEDMPSRTRDGSTEREGQ